MGDSVTNQSTAEIRFALSKLFVDTEVDYQAIAAQVRFEDRLTLKQMLFEEVAPICYPNLATPVPSVWSMFDPDWLETEIEKRLQRRDQSTFVAMKDKLLCSYLRIAYSDLWEKLETELTHF